MGRLAPPVNDERCMAALIARAEHIATTDPARAVAAQLGSEAALRAALRAKPQSDDDGHGPGINCGEVSQRARFWAPDPNCFERALDYLTLAPLLLDDRYVFSAATAQTQLGAHTFPVLLSGNKRIPVDLYSSAPPPGWHRLRNADPRGTRNYSWDDFGKDALGIVHTAGGIVLGAFGLGGVANTLGEIESKYDALPAWADPHAGEKAAAKARAERDRADAAAAAAATKKEEQPKQPREEPPAENQAQRRDPAYRQPPRVDNNARRKLSWPRTKSGR